MKLSIVVPVYQEEHNIAPFLVEIQQVLVGITDDYEIIFSVDPSQDGTAQQILLHSKQDPRVKSIIFSRRIGQPAATLAGLEFTDGDAVIVMDVDLQDPPDQIKLMVEKWRKGYDVIYGVRKSRTGETILKRVISYLGYQLINKISDVEIPKNTGDFRLMSRRAVDELMKLTEAHGFLRGMVALVGFQQTSIEFDRPERNAGKGKYSRYTGSIKIGVNGLVGFSNRPLFLSTIIGTAFVSMAVICLVYMICRTTFSGSLLDSGNLTRLSMLFLFGIQLISIGILGEYVGRIYDEVKGRPRYIIDEIVGFSKPLKKLNDNRESNADEKYTSDSS